MYWYKDAYKKNTKPHLHGGKRELLNSGNYFDADLDEPDYEPKSTQDWEVEEQENVSSAI